VVPPAEHVPTTLTTVADGPSPTHTTTNQDQGEAVVEGEVASRREPPRRVKVDHPAVVWTSLGPLPRWVPGPTTWWAPGTT
jgi:hypothetical protein